MVMAGNVFKLDSPKSYTDKEMTTTSKVAVQKSQGILAHRKSIKRKRKKKVSTKRHDFEANNEGGKKSKKKKQHKRISGGDKIVDAERSKVNHHHEKSLINNDDSGVTRDKGKRRRDDCDLGNTLHKPKKKRSMLAEIAVKSVQLTTSERMAENFKKLTGWMMLSRNKDYLIFYRGNTFLAQKVAEALVEQEKFVRSLQVKEEEACLRERSSALIVPSTEPSSGLVSAITLGKILDVTGKVGKNLDDGHRAEEVKHKVEKLRHDHPFRKLEKKAFLLLGRLGVFNGTVENILLLWKYGEPVKILVTAKTLENVKVALTLKIESVIILVSIDMVFNAYDVIVCKRKESKCLPMLRLENFGAKRKPLACSLKLQRYEGFIKDSLTMQARAEQLRVSIEPVEKIADFKRVKKLLINVRFEHVSSRETLLSSREQVEKDELEVSTLSCMHISRDARTEVEDEKVKLRVADETKNFAHDLEVQRALEKKENEIKKMSYIPLQEAEEEENKIVHRILRDQEANGCAQCDFSSEFSGLLSWGRALQGDIQQSQREITLPGFKKGKFSTLVATNVASCGLDINDVQLIIQCERPHDVENYIHCSGRTKAVNTRGAVMLYSSRKSGVSRIEKQVGSKFEHVSAPWPNDIAKAFGMEASEKITQVCASVVPTFMAAVKELLEGSGVSAEILLAKAFAKPAGLTEIKKRPLLTLMENHITLLLEAGKSMYTPTVAFNSLSRVLHSSNNSLSWYHALSNKIDIESGASQDVSKFYKKAEESMENSMKNWEEMEECRLNGICNFEKHKAMMQKQRLDRMFSEASSKEDTEHTVNISYQINMLWGSLLYELSIVEYKIRPSDLEKNQVRIVRLTNIVDFGPVRIGCSSEEQSVVAKADNKASGRRAEKNENGTRDATIESISIDEVTNETGEQIVDHREESRGGVTNAATRTITRTMSRIFSRGDRTNQLQEVVVTTGVLYEACWLMSNKDGRKFHVTYFEEDAFQNLSKLMFASLLKRILSSTTKEIMSNFIDAILKDRELIIMCYTNVMDISVRCARVALRINHDRLISMSDLRQTKLYVAPWCDTVYVKNVVVEKFCAPLVGIRSVIDRRVTSLSQIVNSVLVNESKAERKFDIGENLKTPRTREKFRDVVRSVHSDNEEHGKKKRKRNTWYSQVQKTVVSFYCEVEFMMSTNVFGRIKFEEMRDIIYVQDLAKNDFKLKGENVGLSLKEWKT